MSVTPIIFEFAVTGFLYLFGILFILFHIFGVKDFSFISQLKDFQIPISIIIVSGSFFIGFIFHRLTLITFPIGIRTLKKIFRKKSVEKTHKFSHLQYYNFRVNLYLFGTERLQDLVYENTKSLSIFRSLIIAVPFFGGSFSLWASTTKLNYITWTSIILTILFTLICILVYRDQAKRVKAIHDSANIELEKIKQKTNKSKD